MCRSYVKHTGIICPLCKKEIYDVIKENLMYQRVILPDLTPATVCDRCLHEAKKNLCKTENCKVLSQDGRDYCIQHNEESVMVQPPAPKLIEDFMDYSTDENSCVKVRQEFKNDL